MTFIDRHLPFPRETVRHFRRGTIDFDECIRDILLSSRFILLLLNKSGYFISTRVSFRDFSICRRCWKIGSNDLHIYGIFKRRYFDLTLRSRKISRPQGGGDLIDPARWFNNSTTVT